VSRDQHSEIPVGEPCALCGAPAGVTCADYMYLQHLNSAHQTVEQAFTSPELDREIELAEFATERERRAQRSVA